MFGKNPALFRQFCFLYVRQDSVSHYILHAFLIYSERCFKCLRDLAVKFTAYFHGSPPLPWNTRMILAMFGNVN